MIVFPGLGVTWCPCALAGRETWCLCSWLGVRSGGQVPGCWWQSFLGVGLAGLVGGAPVKGGSVEAPNPAPVLQGQFCA